MPRITVRPRTVALVAGLLPLAATVALAVVPTYVDSVVVTGRNSGFGASSPDGRFGYFTGMVASSPAAMTKVDLATMAVVGSPLVFNTGENSTGRLAVTPDGASVLVGMGDNSHAGTLVKVDAATMTRTASVALPGAANKRPMAVVVSADGEYAYVGNGVDGNGQGKIWKVRVSDMTVAAGPVNVGGATEAGSYLLLLSPDGSNLYSFDTNADPGHVYRLSTSSMSLTGTITGTTPYPVSGVISPDGHYAYTADYNVDPGVATKYDLTTMQQVATASFPAAPVGIYGLAIAPDGSEIYAADESHPIKVTPIATGSMTVGTGTTVGVGSSYSNAVVASPEGQYIYVNDLNPTPNGLVYRLQVAAPSLLTVTTAGTGAGTVTGASGRIDCGVTCTASLGPAAQVALVATAASGSTFAGWSGDCTGTGPCTVSMSSARGVTATFEPAPATEPSAPGTAERPAAATDTTTGTAPTVSTRGAAVIRGVVLATVLVPSAPGTLTVRASMGRTVACTARVAVAAPGPMVARCQLSRAAQAKIGSGPVAVRVVSTLVTAGGSRATSARTVRLGRWRQRVRAIAG